jgi:hypothetical protein
VGVGGIIRLGGIRLRHHETCSCSLQFLTSLFARPSVLIVNLFTYIQCISYSHLHTAMECAAGRAPCIEADQRVCSPSGVMFRRKSSSKGLARDLASVQASVQPPSYGEFFESNIHFAFERITLLTISYPSYTSRSLSLSFPLSLFLLLGVLALKKLCLSYLSILIARICERYC